MPQSRSFFPARPLKTTASRTPALTLVAALLAGACGAPDTRSFTVENAIFESVYLDRRVPASEELTPEARAGVAAGLSAICKGETGGAGRLIRESRIGERIYRLVLVAAKADRKGKCDYAAWPGQEVLLGDRFKQLVNSGDPAAVLLAALLDKSLAEPDRRRIVEALAGRRYSQAEAIQADLLAGGSPADQQKAQELLADAAQQGATPAYRLLARLHRDGRGVPADTAKACQYLRDAAARGSEAAADELRACK